MTTNAYRCEDGRITLSRDNQGRAWEHFWINNRYQFSNQIPNLTSFSTTEPGWILNDRALCGWAGTPPPRIPATVDGSIPATAPTVPSGTQAQVTTSPAPEGMADPSAGGLMLLALVGAGIWQYVAQRRKPQSGYNPYADLDLTLPPLGNFAAKQTHGIRGVEGDGFAWNSPDLASNSHVPQTAGENGPNLGNLTVPEFSQGKEWQEMGLNFDPLQPEQGDEFEMYRYLVEKDGLAARGVDIIKQMWGCSPGRSRAYSEARKRRDEFAKRLEYYRYEGR